MNIGAIIKKNRREKDLTQEVLAEYLGVSVSAVSQWEAEKTSPDLSLIPPLCYVLDITADELLGIDRERKDKEAEAILEEGIALSDRGYAKEAYDIFAEGLKRFPGNFELMFHQMYTTFSLMDDSVFSAEERRGYGDEGIRLAEVILERCTDDSLRDGAIQVLCIIHGRRGNRDRVKEYAAKASCISTSNEFLMSYAFTGNELDLHLKRLRYDLLQFLARKMANSNLVLDNGEMSYSEEEMAEIRDKVIALFDLMFEKGDFFFYHGLLNSTHTRQAKWYAAKGDGDKVLYHLGKAADHAIGFVRLLEEKGTLEETHTSLLFRGLNSGSISVSYTDNNAKQLLNHMEDEAYDFVRETETFAAITESLQKVSGNWTAEK